MVPRVGKSLAVLLLAGVSAVLGQEKDTPPASPLMSRLDPPAGLGLGFYRYNRLNVFRNPRVQEELNLTEAQRTRLKTLFEDHTETLRRSREAYQSQLEALGERPDPQVQAELRARQSAFTQAAVDKLLARFGQVLDRRQNLHLDQIHYQTEGPMAFTRLEVQRRLNLAPEQIEQIMAIVAQGKQKNLAVMKQPAQAVPNFRSLTPEQRQAALQSAAYKNAKLRVQDSSVQIRGEAMRSISKVLTRRQRENYQKMLGEPFDFTKAWVPAKPEEAPSTTPKSSSN